MSVQTFLREKLTNMAHWLQAAGLTVDVHERTGVEIVAFAQYLHDECANAIASRDFSGLYREHAEVQRIVRFVENRPELHDKFWRYLQLFSETVSTV